MNNLATYKKAYIDAFGITEEEVNPSLVYQGIQAWDSIGHMELIANLEEAFDIMMETEDIIDFSGYEKGIELLKKYEVEV